MLCSQYPQSRDLQQQQMFPLHAKKCKQTPGIKLKVCV